MTNTRFRLYFAFFRSTCLLSVITGVATGIVASLPYLSAGEVLKSSLLSIPTVGLALDLYYKEIAHQEEYCFFYNQGIRKIRLWVVTFLLSAGSCFILYQIIRLCVRVWRWTVS